MGGAWSLAGEGVSDTQEEQKGPKSKMTKNALGSSTDHSDDFVSSVSGETEKVSGQASFLLLSVLKPFSATSLSKATRLRGSVA